MSLTLKARVLRGRLVLDEPMDLPDGTVVDLVLADQGDDLDDEDRARLHEALDRAEEEVGRGETVPASEVLANLPRTPRR